MRTMEDYHDLYLKCEVFLLADVFGRFRKNSLKNYGLCPSHYFSASGLIWNGMFKMTEMELEIIPDSDIFTFFEKGTRVGILMFLIDAAKPTIIFKIS